MTKLKQLLKSIGPGFITGASDDDPAGIATYSQTGAKFGYSQLWTSFFFTPFMITIQEMCGRIGLVTGDGLSGVIRKHYTRPVLYGAVGLLLIANTINIGADLGAMAEAAELVTGIPFIWWLIGIVVVTLILQVFVSYVTYAKFLKYLTLSLLTYVITMFIVKQDWGMIAWSTFVPNFSWDKEYLLNIVAILGTTISPYLFFWQADEEAEEEVAEHKIKNIGEGTPTVTAGDIRKMRYDTVFGMLFSNLIMFFIIATAASTLGVNGISDIGSAADAAEALKPLAGPYASVLFALGIFGTGLLTIPVLSGSSSYALSEAFHWNSGLYRKFREAHGFYGIITIATLVGLLLNFVNIPPFKLLYYSAVLNGLAAPIIMVMILLVANNNRIMGTHTNGWLSNLLGWTITVAMAVAGVVLVATLLFG